MNLAAVKPCGCVVMIIAVQPHYNGWMEEFADAIASGYAPRVMTDDEVRTLSFSCEQCKDLAPLPRIVNRKSPGTHLFRVKGSVELQLELTSEVDFCVYAEDAKDAIEISGNSITDSIGSSLFLREETTIFYDEIKLAELEAIQTERESLNSLQLLLPLA